MLSFTDRAVLAARGSRGRYGVVTVGTVTFVEASPLLSLEACWTAFCASVIARLKPGSGSLTGVTTAGVPHAARIIAQPPSSPARRARVPLFAPRPIDITKNNGRPPRRL